MRIRNCSGLATLILVAGLVGAAAAQSGDGDSAAGHALESIFSPQRAPANKSMGLLQRSFLDQVESSQSRLEVALVVDGTDSMAGDLAGVRQALGNMVADLRRYKGDHVAFQLVVYRDVGSPSGALQIPLDNFTADAALLEREFAKIQPESGAPYFHELVDLGVHEALSKLKWTSGAETTRWIFLFGDAPPFEPGFDESTTGARRRYATDQLINLAARLGVNVNCVLCASRGAEREAFNEVLAQTRDFMSTLSSRTGGLMLDLSYADIRSALAEAVKSQRVEYQLIGKITDEEVLAEQRRADEQNEVVAQTERIRIAVLPHLPLSRMSFDPSRPEVQVAAGLRHKLQLVPTVELSSPVEMERRLRVLSRNALDDNQMLQALAGAISADYVIWGEYQSADKIVTVSTTIYNRVNGQAVAANEMTTSSLVPENHLAGELAMKLISAAVDSGSDRLLGARFASYQTSETNRSDIIRPVAFTPEQYESTLFALEALEQSLGHLEGSPEARDLLERAEGSLLNAVGPARREEIPLAQLLLANCYRNLAQVYVQEGDTERADKALKYFSMALLRAYRSRDKAEQAVAREIEADYALLVQKDIPSAIATYESLAKYDDATSLHYALRAHWMLAGIYSGDWGVDRAHVNTQKARENLVKILAHWPESSEATIIRQYLRWNPESGENSFEHFPKNHAELAGRVPPPEDI